MNQTIIPARKTQIRLATAHLSGYRDTSGNASISAVFTDKFTPSNQVCSWKGFPLSLCEDKQGRYVLQSVIVPSPSVFSLCYRTENFSLGTTTLTRSYGFCITTPDEDNIPAATEMFRGMPLSVNSQKSLIISPISIEPEQVERFYIKGVPFEVQRFQRRWYMVLTQLL